MMGRQSGQMSMLVLDFTELIPDHHLLRKISQAISFDFIYEILKPYYPANGRPSVNPVSMFKMLLVGLTSQPMFPRTVGAIRRLKLS